ncbi:spore germination protein [Siminovitchia terrae]|uniref:Spore germination protein n=1 Tax=Siminovitchia terrae TaxID=1914933 RepID=A0ABQ4KXH0_SIMTE|nr:spore germination protein [Siminovitchia terrae]GIN96722.1 spore germination protein [Siminovitchia terrae]
MIRNVQRLLKRKRKKQTSDDALIPKPQEPLRKSFKENVEAFQSIYKDCWDIVFREFRIFGSIRGMIIYIDGISDMDLLDECVLYPLIQKEGIGEPHQPKLELIENTISISNIKQVSLVADCIESISSGSPILLIEGERTAISLSLPKFEIRGIEEPQSEKVIRGPREGFIESLQVNTSMLRRMIKSPALKMKTINIGEYTKTGIVLAYIEGIASPTLVEEFENRLQRIEIDGVLASDYVEEMIEDNPYSPFPQILSTERPDVVSAHLLEGRAAILTDGTPFAMIAPVSFFSMLQAPDDYYERYFVGTIIRWLRYVFIAISLFLPSLYVAVTTFHQEMIPDPLLLSIAAARESVPYPALVEVILMELMLEALREAGIRLPNQVGAAVSIVGALVIGQAAVQAGLVSAPMVIVVATTGIASFLIPRYILGYSIRFLRFPLVFLAGFLGLLGIMLGFLVIIVHLCTLRSFGEPYMQPLAPLKKRELKDVLWRSPFWMMDTRPHFDGDANLYRQAPDQKPGPLRGGETEN